VGLCVTFTAFVLVNSSERNAQLMNTNDVDYSGGVPIAQAPRCARAGAALLVQNNAGLHFQYS